MVLNTQCNFCANHGKCDYYENVIKPIQNAIMYHQKGIEFEEKIAEALRDFNCNMSVVFVGVSEGE